MILKMSKKGRQQNEKHYLKQLNNYSTKDLLDDDQRFDELDEKCSQYEDETAIEKINSNIRKKLKNEKW